MALSVDSNDIRFTGTQSSGKVRQLTHNLKWGNTQATQILRKPTFFKELFAKLQKSD